MQRNMKVIFAVFILFFVANGHANSSNIDMFQGEVRVLGVFDSSRIAIGNGKIVKVEAKANGELILIAEAAGSSSLRLWLKDGTQAAYNIRVSANDPQTRVRMESMVRMSVKMVEVRKSAIQNLGINWANQINGPALSTAGDFVTSSLFRSAGTGGIDATLPLAIEPFSTHFGLATSISSQINFLASTGNATTLAEPTLSCINGGVASFLAGGEVPYPVTGSNGQVSVEFKEYGIKLDIRPLVDADGNIYTKLLTEISQIDAAVSVLGAPGLLTRRTETEMNVVTGQTIVLSGLLSADNSEDVSKMPWLGDIPFLGSLFRSKNFRNQRTELVIFVTPEVIAPEDARFTTHEKQIYDYGQKTLHEISEAIDFKLMD
jgi:pilus assembly protein CpaC